MSRVNAKWAGLVLAASLLLSGCSQADANRSEVEEPAQETPSAVVEESVTQSAVQESIVPEPSASSDPEGRPQRGGNKGGMGMGMMGPDNDEAVKAVLAECAPKFKQYTFIDPDTGVELEYSLFVPEEYDGSTEYPLIQFMPDSTGTGKSAKDLVENYLGAAVWVSDRDQEKHPCFVLVPAYTEAIADDGWITSKQLETGVKLIYWLMDEYNIDTSKIYTTGQSGGCMASLYLSAVEPELFAASLYVGGQWDINVLDYLKEHHFVYVTAGGDEKATGGQTEIIDMLNTENVKYSYGEWSAQLDNASQSEKAQALLDEGLNANFVRFETGTVSPGSSGFAAEHMASFNFAYKLNSVRDWLFEQSK